MMRYNGLVCTIPAFAEPFQGSIVIGGKTKMKIKSRLLAVVTVVIMMLSMASCQNQDTSWAYEIEGITIPSGMLLYLQHNAYSLANTKVAKELEEAGSDDAVRSVNDLLSRELEGVPVSQWIEDYVIQQCRRYAATIIESQEYGLILDTTDVNDAQSSAQTEFKNYQDIYEKMGVSAATLKDWALDSLRQNSLFTAYYGANGPYEVGAEDQEAYFIEAYALATMYFVNMSGMEDTNAINSAITEFITAVNGDTPFIEALIELESHLPEENRTSGLTDEDSTVTESNFIGLVPKEVDNTTSQALIDAVWELAQFDRYDRIDLADGSIYIICRKDLSDSVETYLMLYGNDLLKEMKAEDFTEKLDGIGETLSVTSNEATLKKYSIKDTGKRWEELMEAYA